MEAAARAELARRAAHELKRRKASRDLADFILFTYPEYKMGWVHREICETLDGFLQAVIDRRSPRLIVCMPPRSGKSEIVSRRFPAYAFGLHPDLQIIATSYASSLAQRFNRDVQRIIDDEPYREAFPDTRLNQRAVVNSAFGSYIRTSDLFEIVGHKGSYRSTGVGGGITGQGADILIVDDPLKDRAEAGSATMRNGLWDWFTSTAYTRLSPGGGVIVMATRWHTDDLIGRLISAGERGEGDRYKLINYPAIAEHDEPHRKEGEALHPERYGLKELLDIKRTIGSFEWAALYQQHPIPEGGAMFKRDQIVPYAAADCPPRFDQIVGSWDMTFKDSAGSDYVVGQVWGQKGADYYLLDLVRGRWDFVKTLEVFTALANKWPRAHKWLIEDKANGSAVLSTLKHAVSGLLPITPTESKTARANAVTALWEAHNVHIPAEAPWLSGFTDELLNFPSVAHDDQVDAMTQALNYMRLHHGPVVNPANIRYMAARPRA